MSTGSCHDPMPNNPSGISVRISVKMDGDGDGPDAERILLDQINYDSTAIYEHYGEEEARSADSFLNMSRDGIEEDDADFASSEIPIRCGVVVWARVPITRRLWKTKNPDEECYTVPPNQKEMLWGELKDMLILPEGVDEELVKKSALKKMALSFSTFKKKLFGNYVKKDEELDWDSFPQVKPY
ncbi:hypothetical protein C2845_PM16G03800 [Panicum miliaceum]|uniref:Uncharacterized protein n=1 Tax=Panicum miliaceum TaxID=4540 RepID=A0A3L6PWJ0_PANMI|nr:hypothetical protein C2845_PM16G03800 [Panicum miliaceum]